MKKISKYKKGNIFHTIGGSTIRVLESIEGYVFFRYKGAYPCVLSEAQFEERLKRESEDGKSQKIQ